MVFIGLLFYSDAPFTHPMLFAAEAMMNGWSVIAAEAWCSRYSTLSISGDSS